MMIPRAFQSQGGFHFGSVSVVENLASHSSHHRTMIFSSTQKEMEIQYKQFTCI